MDRVPIPLPEGLELMPPGPDLGEVLASIGVASLVGEDTVDVLQAEYRQLAQQNARVLRVMVEVGLAKGPKSLERLTAPPEFAPDEVRAALVLTRTSATMQMSLAWDLYDRLPEVLARMEQGILDLPRARILSDWTTDLRPDAARAVIAAVLPRAHLLTTGALAAEVKTLAIAIDPTFAERRYKTAVTGRKVVARRNPDGTANLCGYDLPVDQVATVSGYVQAMAAAAKRQGHPGKIDHIRADLYLLLLTPGSRHLSDADLIAELIRRAQAAAAAAAEPPAQEQPPAQEPPASAGPPPTPPGGATTPSPRGRGVEIRVRLTTMLGRDHYPGQMPGWIGPVHAELAIHTVMANTGGPWRYVICDDNGMLTHTGPLRTRPAGTVRSGAATVEIQVDADLLAELAADPDQTGVWAPVVRELVKHAAAPPEDHTGDRDKRLPGVRLRRFVYVRDRECVFPGCRIPAHHTDVDHTDDHGHGGETVEENLAPACRHDHRIKHEAGWRLEQPTPGHLRWTSRLGHTYDVKPKPIIPPLPDPIPPDPNGRVYDLSGPDVDEQPDAPRPPPVPPTPPPTTEDDDDEPPF